MRPTHVMVGYPVDCKVCKGTGRRPEGHLSFQRIVGSNGEDVCPECSGAKLRQAAITLEDFAKMFTWGQDYDEAAMRGERAPKNVLRVAPENEPNPPDESNG